MIGIGDSVALNQERRQLLTLEATPPLHLSFLAGRTRTLVISLAGVGRRPRQIPSPEFFKTASEDGRNHVLFVSDMSRSWLNGPDLARNLVAAIETTAAAIKPERIVAIGNSMGGTMALHLASLTRFDTVVAVVPQYSVMPQRVPEEGRWLRYRKRIGDWPFAALDHLPTDLSETIVFHGGSADELVHLDRFPRDPLVKHYVFPTLDHRLAFRLNQAGLLAPMIGNAIAGMPWKFRRSVERAGGITRRAFDAARSDRSDLDTGDALHVQPLDLTGSPATPAPQ